MLFEPAVLCACFFLFFCVCSLASRINSVVAKVESAVGSASAAPAARGAEGKDGKGVKFDFDQAAAAEKFASDFEKARNAALKD